MGYSVDLRIKAVKHRLGQSTSCADTAKVFGVGRSTVQSWVQRYEETGDLSDKPFIRKPKKMVIVGTRVDKHWTNQNRRGIMTPGVRKWVLWKN